MNEITKRTIADYKNYLFEEEKCSVTIAKESLLKKYMIVDNQVLQEGA